MNLVLTSSEHSKETFLRSVYGKNDQQGRQIGEIKASVPIQVLFEGLDTDRYFKTSTKSNSKLNADLDSINESFCFLAMGHWMQGDLGHDRKNIGYTIKTFLETFKNKTKPPALILRVQQSSSSIMDQSAVLKKIDMIRKTVKGNLPNIYLIHGDLSDEEVNGLYNHNKVKAFVSLTKGEGFGRPILEFGVTGKPIIASGWSGHMDFLSPQSAFLVSGELENVHESAAVENVLMKESQWFKPDPSSVGKTLKLVFKKYKDALSVSRTQPKRIREQFTYAKMQEKLSSILDDSVPEFAQEVELQMPQLNLPKLKKLDT